MIMNNMLDYITTHQFTVMAVGFVCLLVFYFIFKQLIKLALFFLLIALAVGGYYYFKDPHKMPQNIRQTIKDTRETSEKIVETGKKAYKTGQDVYEKSKELTKGAKEFFKQDEEKPGKGQ
jgi:hypothetical protein